MAMIYPRPSYCPTCLRLRVESVAPAIQPQRPESQERDTSASGLNEAMCAIERDPGERPFTVKAFRAGLSKLRAAADPMAAHTGLNDERLAEMETHHTRRQDDQEAWCYGCDEVWPCDGMVLIAEVRRLRRALQLSEASRGMPGVGRD